MDRRFIDKYMPELAAWLHYRQEISGTGIPDKFTLIRPKNAEYIVFYCDFISMLLLATFVFDYTHR